MKMKLNNIILLNNIIKSIIDTDKNLKIDALFKFKLLGIMKKLEDPIENFDIVRNDKIREYGQQNKDGNITISLDDKDALKKFTDDLNAILNSEVDINIVKLKAENVFNAGVPAEYLVKLYTIMEE